MKKRFTRHYPLFTVNGDEVGMNVQFRKGTKYWSFQCYPDPRLDEPFSDRVFRCLCENDGIMYSLARAFHDYPNPSSSRDLSIWMSAVWLSGNSFNWEHVEHILKSVLPHWQKAGKIIEFWLSERRWGPVSYFDMMKELYDEKENSKCWVQYQGWAHERYQIRKKHRLEKGK